MEERKQKPFGSAVLVGSGAGEQGIPDHGWRPATVSHGRSRRAESWPSRSSTVFMSGGFGRVPRRWETPHQFTAMRRSSSGEHGGATRLMAAGLCGCDKTTLVVGGCLQRDLLTIVVTGPLLRFHGKISAPAMRRSAACSGLAGQGSLVGRPCAVFGIAARGRWPSR